MTCVTTWLSNFFYFYFSPFLYLPSLAIQNKSDIDDVRREVAVLEMMRSHPKVARLEGTFEDAEVRYHYATDVRSLRFKGIMCPLYFLVCVLRTGH